MRRSSWSLGRLFSSFGSSKKSKKGKGWRYGANKKRSFSIEPLEERTLLSVCTWDGGGGNNNWSTAANWLNDVAPVAGNDLVFTGATQLDTTNDYPANTQFGSITIEDDNFSIGGNSFRLAGGITIGDSSSTPPEAASGVVIGADVTFVNESTISFVDDGGGLTFSGNVTFTGHPLHTTGNGTVEFDGLNKTYQGGGLWIQGGSTAKFSQNANLSLWTMYVGIYSSGSLEWNSTGTLTAGTLLSVGFGATGTVTQTSGYVIASGATYGFGFSGDYSSYSLHNGSLHVTKIDNTANHTNCSFDLSGARLRALSGNFSVDDDITFNLSSGWTYFDTMGYSVTVEGDFSGDGNLIKCYTGSLTLAGSDSHTGLTRIGNGTLVLGDSSALQDSTLCMSNVDSGTFSFGTLTSATLGGLSGESSLSLQNASLTAVALTVGGNDDSTIYSGTLSGGSLIKVGTGTLTLSGVNTYTGGTQIAEGTIVLSGGNNRLSTSGVITITGGVFDLGGNTQTSTAICFHGGVVQNGTLDTSDSGIYYATAGIVSANLTGSSSHGMTKGGEGTLTLTGTNTFDGIMFLGGGAICFGNNALNGQADIVVDVDTTLQWATGSTTDISSRLTIADGIQLTLDTNGNDITLATSFGDGGELYDDGSVVKAGEGTLVLGEENGYSGGTTISAGTLQVGDAGAIPSGSGKGNVTVDGVLDLNGYSIAINGLSGSGTITSGVVGDVTLTVGGNNQISSFSGRIEDGEGVVALTKIGTGTVTFADTQTYTGDTTVTAGTLNVLGNLNSHTIEDGGTVTNSIFYDPHVASTVREALGLDADAVLTANDLTSLTSLTLDSNLVFSLEGLEYATNLETLALIPGDYSLATETLTNLEPLDDLANLTTLTLQNCGLTANGVDGILDTSIDLPALESLDLRYNDITLVPSWIAALSDLEFLYVYGNEELVTDAGDANYDLGVLAGTLINIDLEPLNPEDATTIEELAEACYYLPIEMYEYVLNTVEYQAYAGSMKGALATLQSGAGNDWDMASLLKELFDEVNDYVVGSDPITTEYVYGSIEVSSALAEAYVGVLDATAAESVFYAAGLNPDYDEEEDTITFDHTWLEVTIDSVTYKLDPSWKFRDFQDGLGNMLENVSFNYSTAGDYLSEVRVETSVEYYAQKVREYLANPANGLTDKTIADVAYDGPILQQAVTTLPTTLPYATGFSNFTVNGVYDSQDDETTLTASTGIFSEDMEGTTSIWIEVSGVTYEYAVLEYTSSTVVIVDGNATGTSLSAYLESTIIPEASTHRVKVEMTGGGESFSWSGALSDVSLEQLTIDPTVSGDYSRPRLLLNGTKLTELSDSISKTAVTTITITHYYGASQVSSASYPRIAQNYVSVGLNGWQMSDQMLVDAWSAVNDAQISKFNGGTPTNDELIGSLLYLDAMTYYHKLNESNELVAGLTGAVPQYNYVGSCLVTSTTDLHTTHDDDQQVAYRPKSMWIDVKTGNHFQTPIVASDSYRVMRYNLLGYTSSALESTVWESIVNIPSTSTIQSLQYANEESISIVEFDADDNLYAITTALAAIDNSYYLRDSIADEIDTWVHTVYEDWVYTAIIPTDETPVGDNPLWNGVGCILCVNGFAANYMIYGIVTGSSQCEMIQGGWAGGTQNTVDEIYVTLNANTEGDPIDTANGDVVHETTDISIENLGYTLELSRKYDSYNVDGSGDSDRGMGEGWSFTYSDRLEFDGNDVIWFTDEGIRHTFESLGGGAYTTPDTIFGDMVYDSGDDEYTWTDSYGNIVVFDEYGRLVQMLDCFGSGVDIDYDDALDPDSTHILTVSDHQTPARCLTFTYTNDLITSIADFYSRSWTYTYSGGQLASVTTPSDNDTPQQVTSYDYYTDTTRDGLLETITYPDSTETNFFYYANRRGFQVTDSNGNTDTMIYNLYNLGGETNTNTGRTTYIDRRGDSSVYTYDENGYLTEVQYSDWTTESYTWDDADLLASVTDAYGQTEEYAYDDDGCLTVYIDRAGYVTTYDYTSDGFNNIDTITYTNDVYDGETLETNNEDLVYYFTYTSGKLTHFYEAYGDANQTDTVYTYNGTYGSYGLPDTITSPEGGTTTFTYNNAGQILTATYSVSATESITESFDYEADGYGNLTKYTDGEGNETDYDYDLLGRVSTITYPDPDGAGNLPAPHETYTYNSAGLLETVTVDTSGIDPLITSYTYDDMWRKTRIKYADGTYVSYDYDQDGNLLSESDELGNTTRYVYDARGRMIATIFADGGVFTTAYDGGSRIVTETDALGNSTEYEYDLLGRVVKITDAEDGETEYVYDVAGNLSTVTDPLSNVTAYTYDKLGRIIADVSYTSDGLIGYWKFDDGDGTTATDSSGNDVDGTLLPAEGEPEWTDGQYGDAIEFDTTNYVKVENLDVNTDAGAKNTVSFWMNWDGTNAVMPFGWNTGYDLWMYNGYLGFNTAQSDLLGIEFTANDWAGEWVQVTAVFYNGVPSAETVELYINGQKQELSQVSGTPTSRTVTTTALISGWGVDSYYRFDGLIDDLRIYNRALSADEIAAMVGYTYTYDDNSNLISVTDALGNTTTYDYDEADRQIAVNLPDPDGDGPLGILTTEYKYNNTGDLVQVVDPSEWATQYNYDYLGRVICQKQFSTDALLGAWGFEEPSGAVAYDASPNGNDGQLSINPPTRVDGPSGNELQFNGSDNAVVIPASDSLNSIDSSFTISLRFKYLGEGTADKVYWTLLNKNATGSGHNDIFHLFIRSDNKRLCFRSGTGTTNLECAIGAAVDDGEYHQVDVVYDDVAKTYTTYLDGQQAGMYQMSQDWTIAQNSAPLTLGYWTCYQSYFNGIIDELQIYDRVFSADDVTESLTWPTVSYEYDAYGDLVAVTDPLDNTTTYQYNTIGQLVAVTDALGNTTSHLYDAAGNIVRVTEALTDDDVLSAYALGATTEYVYDSVGQLLSTTDAEGGVTEYTYDLNGDLLTFTDALDVETRYEYDNLGRLIRNIANYDDGVYSSSYTDEDVITEYEYDAAGNLVSVTDALNVETQYEYDNLGRLIKIIDNYDDGVYSSASPDVDVITEYEYDAMGYLVTVTDVLGVETRYEYDALGRVNKTIANYVDGVYSSSYTDEDVITEYEYDDDGNLSTVTDVLGVETRYEYDNLGQLTKIIANYVDGVYSSANPDTDVITEYEYDAAGYLVSTTDNSGVETRYEYDNLGQLIKTIENYDDGVYSSGTPDTDVITEYAYDAVGNLVSTTDALGNTTTYTYDALGRLLTTTDAEDGVTTYTYDSAGNLLTLTDPEENTTTYTYDDLGRMVTETNELSKTATYVYNAVGLLVRTIDREGRVIVYQYDDLYRNTYEIWYDDTTDADADQDRVSTISYTYDAVGNLLTASDSAASYSYTYDDLNRLTQQTQTISGLSSTVVIDYTYDATGNLTQTATTIGGTADAVTDYEYDALGRVIRIEQYGNAVSEKRIDLTYDARSQYASISYYSDLDGLSTDLVMTATYTYDSLGQLTDLVYTDASEATIREFEWVYNAVGWITSHDSDIASEDVTSYTYDATGQLLTVDYASSTDESYTYDENGNRITANGDTYTTGDDNQTTSDGTYSYIYDDNGNMQFRYVDVDESESLNSGDTDITEYEWDSRNRLIKVSDFDDYTDYTGDDPSSVIDYVYDCFNRRVGSLYDSDGDGDVDLEERYAWDDDNVVLDFVDEDGDGVTYSDELTTRYLWGQAVDELLAQENVDDGGVEDVLYPVTDNLGSVRSLVEYDGDIASTFSYDSYGNVTVQTGSITDTRYHFTCQEYDVYTCLYYYDARWYDPTIGKFISEDPISFYGGDTNLYRYVNNNPLNYVDPWGYCKEESKDNSQNSKEDEYVSMEAPDGKTYQVPKGTVIIHTSGGWGFKYPDGSITMTGQRDDDAPGFWDLYWENLTGNQAAAGNAIRIFVVFVTECIEEAAIKTGDPILAGLAAFEGSLARSLGDMLAGIVDLPGTIKGTLEDVDKSIEYGRDYGILVGIAKQTGIFAIAEIIVGTDAETGEKTNVPDKIAEAAGRISATTGTIVGAIKAPGLIRSGVNEGLSKIRKSPTQVAPEAPAPKAPVKEGIYEFPDQKAGGKPYVGQSGDVPGRLGQHESAGRLTPGTEKTTPVSGGKTAREIAEHNRIQQITGGQKASKSPAVSNQRDPIGPNRRQQLGIPDPHD